ncbi:MAG: M20/M25/M40 family metallo-hydrolase [Bacteroidetes bacterium]|nr:M20/M25/M40 family metallo-hydrolase [Bacteroidota bacterium]
MKNYPILIALVLILNISQSCTTKNIQPEITQDELHDHIDFLASDSLKGRYPGTAEDKVAAHYIAKELSESGLQLLYDNGLQDFKITTKLKAGDNNQLSVEGKDLSLIQDYIPVMFSSNDSLEAKVVFVGYGFKIEQGNNSWNDYATVDVKGKWVMILRGEPENAVQPLPFSMFSGLRSKAITAKDQGAAGVLFVSGEQFDQEDELLELSKPEGELDIPVIHLKREVANTILSNCSSRSISEIEKNIQNDQNSFACKSTVKAQTDLVLDYAETYNVAAQLIINPEYEYIVIGGHYDHLGFGGQGTGTRAPGKHEIHHGADDNASGVSAMLEIAEKLKAHKDTLETNFIFVAFGAEEMGLLGSKYFVNNLPVDDSLIKAMINIDMVGRMKNDKSLQIGGVGTSVEGESLLTALNDDYNFKLGFSQEGYGPSDHSSFYSNDIPVFFFSTGAHIDYHTPADSTGNINFDGLFEVSNFIYDFAVHISTSDQEITYQESGPKAPSRNTRNKRLKVTLGIMPDFSGVEKKGLRADIVVKGKPAYKAGMQDGDIITAIDGNPVGDVYEYMERLAKLKPGQIITVEVIRKNETKVLIVQL